MIRLSPAILFIITALVMQGCSSERMNSEINIFSREIQEMSAEGVYQAAVDRFGPPTRNIGSGVSIPTWELDGGTLICHPYTGPAYTRGNRTRWLINTHNPAGECVTKNYEMYSLPSPQYNGSHFWIGNISLNQDATYRYEDSGQNLKERGDQTTNFFINHPAGTYTTEYLPPFMPNTALETIPGTARIAKLTFTPSKRGSPAVFFIASDRGSRSLSFESDDDITFVMHTSWRHFWNN